MKKVKPSKNKWDIDIDNSDNDVEELIDSRQLIDNNKQGCKRKESVNEHLHSKKHDSERDILKINKPKSYKTKEKEQESIQFPQRSQRPQPGQLNSIKEEHEKLIDKVLQLEEEMLSEHKGQIDHKVDMVKK